MVSPSLSKVNPISQAGFGSGKSEIYDKARSSYPSEVLSHIRTAVSGKNDLKVVEIGCGSGIFTRALLAHPEWSSSISELKCVDPNEGMRAVFLKTVNDPRVSLSEGTFEDTGVPDGWADLILVATAFHWCTELEDATREFVRILKPEGAVSFTWNRQDLDKAPWIRQIREQHAPPTATREEDRNSKWQRMFDLPLYKEKFFEPEDKVIRYSESGTVERYIQRVLTSSVVAVLPDDGKQQIAEKAKVIIARGDGLVWLKKEEGIFEVPFAAPVVILRRRSPQS